MSDPLMNAFSRLPLSEVDGYISSAGAEVRESPSRPFGLRYAVSATPARPVETKHEKPPTRKSKTRQTKRQVDGKDGPKTESDTEHYVEYD